MKKIDQSKELDLLIKELTVIKQSMQQKEAEYKNQIVALHPNYKDSGRNFIHYLALRTFNLRPLQEKLSNLGLSSIGSSERYNMTNIDHVLYWLHLQKGTVPSAPEANTDNVLGFFESQALLQKNTKRLLGKVNHRHSTRKMVTLPTEAAEDYCLVRDLMLAGMNVARINCGHDKIEVWEKMIANIRKAESECSRPCLIYMDLAGPKLRTGSIKNKSRKKKKKRDRSAQEISVKKGDQVRLYRKSIVGKKVRSGKKRKALIKLSVTLPSIFSDVRPNHRVIFDDGRIKGKIIKAGKNKILVRITRAGKKGSRLRGDMGINLPDTTLQLPALTEMDLHDLPFIARHANLIGYSFVRKPEDVKLLQENLKEINKEDLGIVLKIETREAFDNLPQLILTVMKSPTVGIMTARGDLAVEIGWERISEVQEEILWFCEAAHIPNIWATQVLENLAKKGMATRAEITDAAMSARAECVMLNKGPYIIEALKALDNILLRMHQHQEKRKEALRPLRVAQRYLESLNS